MFKYVKGTEFDFEGLPDTALMFIEIDDIKYFVENTRHDVNYEVELTNIITKHRVKKNIQWTIDRMKIIGQREKVIVSTPIWPTSCRCTISDMEFEYPNIYIKSSRLTISERYKALVKFDPELVDAIKNNNVFEVGDKVSRGKHDNCEIVHISGDNVWIRNLNNGVNVVVSTKGITKL